MEITLGELLCRKLQEQDGDVFVSPSGGQPGRAEHEGKFSILSCQCSAPYPECIKS